MERRKFLLGVGSASIGGSALLGAGAFSRVESQRQVSIQVAQDPNAYLGLTPLNAEWGETTVIRSATKNGDNYVDLDEKGHLVIDIGENPNGGHGVNSNSKTWFDGLFELCNQGKEDVCVSWDFGADAEIRDDAELVFYYDGDLDPDPSTSGRVDVEAGREVHLPLGGCVVVGLRTETFDVDATEDEPLFSGTIELTADVDGECFEDHCIDPVETTWSIGPDPEEEEVGGPVTLLGIDSEDGGIGGHGPISSYVSLVESILDKVNNDEDGILVIGEAGSDQVGVNTINEFWDEIGAQTGESITYVAGVNDIQTASFSEFAMLAVVTAEDTVFQSGGVGPGEGLTDAENNALIDRSDDIAAFVNNGGGLMGSSQDGLTNYWGYIGGLNTFEVITGLGYSSITPTSAGEDVGITTPEMNVCCWHDTFTAAPGFLDVLAWRAGYGDGSATADEIPEGHQAAAIGGEDAVLPPIIDIAITGLDSVAVGSTESYEIAVSNIGEEPAEEVEIEVEAINGGSVTAVDLPSDPFALEQGFDETWENGIEVTCNEPGTLEIEVRLVGADTGGELADITVNIECVPETGFC